LDDLSKPLRVVSLRDEALDLRVLDAKRYAATRDEAMIASATLPGRVPVWHTIRPLGLPDLDTLALRPEGLRARLAYELAIVQVEGCAKISPGGAAWRPEREIEGVDGRPRPAPTAADMDLLFRFLPHGRDDMLEIGLVAMERADQGNGARGDVNYMAPPLLSDVLTRSAHLRAEQTRGMSVTPT
jgi:hypothetical protein